MVVKVSDNTWMVTVEDTSVMNYARSAGHRQTIHGYVQWTRAGFQVYFSHVTQQSPDRETRRMPPMVIPVPISPQTAPIIRHCILVEFSGVLFCPDLLAADSLSLNVPMANEDRTEMVEVMSKLQSEIDSMEDGDA